MLASFKCFWHGYSLFKTDWKKFQNVGYTAAFLPFIQQGTLPQVNVDPYGMLHSTFILILSRWLHALLKLLRGGKLESIRTGTQKALQKLNVKFNLILRYNATFYQKVHFILLLGSWVQYF